VIWDIIISLLSYGLSFLAFVGFFAVVVFDWEPSQHLVALAAFAGIQLGFYFFGQEASNKIKEKEHVEH